MKIGVTGTRFEITPHQEREVFDFLSKAREIDGAEEFHHGDCVGADVKVAEIAKSLGYKIVCHPPEKEDLRGFFNSDETRKPNSYFARNRAIVDECDFLIVVPYHKEWQPNGGTWYTHDYAQKKAKPLTIFWPE